MQKFLKGRERRGEEREERRRGRRKGVQNFFAGQRKGGGKGGRRGVGEETQKDQVKLATTYKQYLDTWNKG